MSKGNFITDKISIGPVRIKRFLSPVQKVSEVVESNLILPENNVEKIDNETSLEAEIEYSDDVLTMYSPSLRKYKRRRSILGTAARVKTPSKDDPKLEGIVITDANKENMAFASPNTVLYNPSSTKNSNKIIINDNIIKEVCYNDERRNSSIETNKIKIISTLSQNRGSITRRGSSCSTDSSSSSNRLSVTEEELKQRPWCIDDFILSKPLGKGKFGNVYLGKEKRTKTVIALKVLFKTPMVTADCVHNLRREIEIQCRLKHPNIVHLFGYFHDQKNVYLILQYIPHGELFKSISRHGGYVPENICKSYVSDISAAISHMHSNNIIHRDIKPENILITEDNRLKLTDFGWAVHAPPPRSIRYTFCGTPEYLSPEMIEGVGHTLAVDLWALGILIYELLFGRTPFFEKRRTVSRDEVEEDTNTLTTASEAHSRMYEKIKTFRGDLEFPSFSSFSSDAPVVSEDAKKLIVDLLQYEPTSRITSLDVYEHHWSKNK